MEEEEVETVVVAGVEVGPILGINRGLGLDSVVVRDGGEDSLPREVSPEGSEVLGSLAP